MTRRRSGFTLVEVLIVIVVIAILAAIVIPRLLQAGQEARENSSKATFIQLNSLNTLEQLQTLKGSYLGGKFLREHGAVKAEGDNPELIYYRYTPTAYGRPVIITIDTSYGTMVDIAPEKKPKGPTSELIKEQAFRSIVAESRPREVDIVLEHPRLGLVQVTKDKEGLKMTRLEPPSEPAQPPAQPAEK